LVIAPAGGHAESAERNIQSLQSLMRTKLAELPYELPYFLYKRLAEDCNRILNLRPTSLKPNTTPMEDLTGRKIPMKNILKATFGTIGVFKVPNETRPDRITPSGELGIIVGFEPVNPSTVHAYIPSRKAIVSRSSYQPVNAVDVVREHFQQFARPSSVPLQVLKNLQSPLPFPVTDLPDKLDPNNVIDSHLIAAFYAPPDDFEEEFNTSPVLKDSEATLPTGDMTLKQALAQMPEAEVMKAVDAEFSGLLDREVFSPIHKRSIPPKSTILPSKLIIRNKFDAHGNFTKLKGRLVAGGHRQGPTSYGSVSYSMVETSSVFLIAALSKKLGVPLACMDVPQAYLHADLEQGRHDPLVMILNAEVTAVIVKTRSHLKPFVQPDGRLYLLIHKSLYGLKQAGYNWDKLVTSVIVDNLGYTQSKFDKSVFFRCCPKTKSVSLICIHVDDLLLCASIPEQDRVHKIFQAKFGTLEISGNHFSYLGIAFSQGVNGDYLLTQTGYVQRLCNNLPDLKESPTPSTASFFTDGDPPGDYSNMVTKFLSLLMSIMFVAIRTRPDILKECVHLSSFAKNPGPRAFANLYHVYGYLKRTIEKGIILGADDFQINVYCDASYAIHADSRSHYGFKLTLGDQGGPVYVRSSKIKLIVGSSTESELYACSEAVRFALPFLKFFEETKLGPADPHILIHQDNQSTMLVIENGEGHPGKAKAFRVRYHHMKQLLQENLLKVQYLPTEDMERVGVDLLTKPTVGQKYHKGAAGLLNLY
jgi:hypothetical protein